MTGGGPVGEGWSPGWRADSAASIYVGSRSALEPHLSEARAQGVVSVPWLAARLLTGASFMISHRYKCIFVEVPKTGSTSIRAIIGAPPKAHQNIWQLKYNMEHEWTRYEGFHNRILASLYLLLPDKTRREVGTRQFDSYFKFGFVRNPWDRVVSLYLRREGLQLRDKMSFEQFVDWIKYSSSTCIHPMPHTNQLDWLVDPHGNVLVDFIGKFEQLADDWATVAGKLGLSRELPHENRNLVKDRPYAEMYSTRTQDIIANKFKVDIEYFGYEFGK